MGQKRTKEIALSQGKVAVVDAADFADANRWRWSAHKIRNTFYAVRKSGASHVYLHREIMASELRPSLVVDHKDGDGLNNCRSNLRVCTRRQNQQNRVNVPRNNTSGHIGVLWSKHDKRWRAVVVRNRKRTHLGQFGSKSKAVQARRAFETNEKA